MAGDITDIIKYIDKRKPMDEPSQMESFFLGKGYSKGKKDTQKLVVNEMANELLGSNNGAHGAIDGKILAQNLNPKNIKNQVNSETLDIYGLFEDYMFNMGTAIFNAQTQGGDNRFYKRKFSHPSTYGLDDNEPYSTKDQIMQLLSNSIRDSPDDTVSTQSVQDLYKLHKQPMPPIR